MPRYFFRYIVIIFLLVILSFSYGYLKTLLSLKEPNRVIKNDQHEDVAYIPEVKLNPGAKLTYITYYLGCSDSVIEEVIIDENKVGFTRNQLQMENEEWFIDSFDSDAVILKRDINGICKEHYYIGIQDGYVSFFQGMPGYESTLIEKTDIMAETLRADDRLILERGLLIKGSDEFLQIREGLTK